jgi:flagellar biosynthesis/type III secretory pathway chaperone
MKELTDILNQELDSSNRFLVLLDNQHRQLVCRDLEGLNKTNAELDLLCNKIGDFEKKRQKIVKNISGQMKLSSDNLTLNDILSRLDGISSNRLQQLRKAILDVHRRIEEKRKRNEYLIEKSRNLVAESVKILSSRPSPVYGRPGPTKFENHEGKIVNRAI